MRQSAADANSRNHPADTRPPIYLSQTAEFSYYAR
jgi:hypothetical protein